MIASKAVVLTMVLTGCSWSVFDDLSDQAWVDSSAAPDDLNADDYGVAVAAGGGEFLGGAVFMAIGLRPDGVADISYAVDGRRPSHSSLISANASSPDPLTSQTPLVGDPTGDVGQVAVGLSENDGAQGRIIVFGHTGDGPSLVTSISVGTGAIDAMGFGITDFDGDTTPDLVATQADLLWLIGAYDHSRTMNSCRIDREQGYAVALADFDNNFDGQELAVSMGNASQADAPAEIQFLPGSLIVTADDTSDQEVQCLETGVREPLLVLAPPADEPDFGAHMQVGDFDGDGTPDLAISAPRESAKVYVYMNIALDTADPGDPLELAAPSGSVRFGDSLTAGDFDGDGADELVVGDSLASADGKTAAGRAYIYVHSGAGFDAPLVLGDAQPEDNQRFGRSMTVATFNGDEQVLVVAAQDEIFTYYRTPVAGDTDFRDYLDGSQ